MASFLMAAPGGNLRPDFTIGESGTVTTFWQRTAGSAVLAPHARARYTLITPNYPAMPAIENGFQVLAFTQGPASVSRTSSYLASNWRVVLQPDTIDQPVPVGETFTVHAQILNRLDQPVHVGHVPAYLGQVIYAQQDLEYAQAYINNGAEGQTPVGALTNSDGVATFTIHSQTAGPDPVYFEANLVSPSQFYPYGYSPILTVRFSS